MAKKSASKGATRTVKKNRKPTVAFSLPTGLLVRLLGVVSVFAVLWLSGSWLQTQIQQPIANVSVTGALTHVDAAGIQRLLQAELALGEGIEPDLERAREVLLQNPWIASAAMRRRWPDQLEVEIKEREPVARWGDKGFITDAAEVFVPITDTKKVKLPVLVGPKNSAAEIWARYQWLSAKLQKDGVGVSRLQKERRGAWRMSIFPLAEEQATTVSVFLGRDLMAAKVERLAKLLRKGLVAQLSDVQRVDLRYSNGASLLWKA